MVSDDIAARSVWLEAETGVCAELSRGAFAVASSSVTPTWILELEAAVGTAGADLVTRAGLRAAPAGGGRHLPQTSRSTGGGQSLEP